MTKFHEALPILLWVLACGVVLPGCGGSASETPPPMEPSTNPRAPYVQTEPASKAPQPKRVADPDAESKDPDAAGDGEGEGDGESEGEPPSAPARPQ